MSIFDKLFGTSKNRNPLDDKPPMYGGDGSSASEAVVVNCASMSTANHLIDRFISERHGKRDDNWKRGVEMFDNSTNQSEFTIRMISVECKDGTVAKYYFNVSRPMAATKKLAKMMGTFPDNIE